MKNSLIALSFVLSSLGIFAQQLDSLSTNQQDKATDFSNPASLFTQATLNGGIDAILSGPGDGNGVQFQDASWYQNIGTEVAIGNIGIGTTFGYSNLAYEVILRPTAFISYLQPLKLGDLKALKMTIAGGIPVFNFDDQSDQVLPFYTHNTLHFKAEVMADVQLSRSWRITPYLAFNQYKTLKSNTLYFLVDSNGNFFQDTTKLQPISALRNLTLGFNLVQSYSNTHFLQFHASATFRNHINLTNNGWQKFGEPDLSPLFYAGITYHTAIWKTLMFNVNLGFTSVNNSTLNNYTSSMGWNLHIGAGLRYGL
jgi:hypothetical protein